MQTLLANTTKWIKAPESFGTAVPYFSRKFTPKGKIISAVLEITSHGVYHAEINGKPVSDYVLAPGWTAYEKRLQCQSYDISALIETENKIEVSVGEGWLFMHHERKSGHGCPFIRLLAAITLTYKDGTKEVIPTDASWQVQQGKIRFSNLYMGETFDAGFIPTESFAAIETDNAKELLIPQQGEIIKEITRLEAIEEFLTPQGDIVIDFGQNMTGYVEFYCDEPAGTELVLHHAEVMDAEGNFYTENYRAATNEIRYISDGRPCCWHPTHSFQGFRYIKVQGFSNIDLSHFSAVVVCSDMKRTGYFSCSDEMVNKLFENVIWGQRGNFLDVPTDCPQRDERLGWTGDAQVFAHVASLNFNTKKFFTKWLADMAADQMPNGLVPQIIPDLWDGNTSSAWGDVATIIPWQIYLTYGDKALLATHFPMMKKWVDYITTMSTDGLWDKSQHHYGDWLGLDAEPGSYKGSTDQVLIATAFYSYSTELLVKAGKVLGKDMSVYEKQLATIKNAFCARYLTDGKLNCDTQTSCVLALHFGLVEDKAPVIEQLVGLIHQFGHLTTGFVGTPYLLHVLSNNGQAELAYELLLRREFPGWLYPITKGATTMWEHWDGIKPDGSMWSKDMNSFNHYAYGAVGDWMYSVICGIHRDEAKPGFANILFKPIPSAKLQWAKAEIDTENGAIRSEWRLTDKGYAYSFTVPKGCTAQAEIRGKTMTLHEGINEF